MNRINSLCDLMLEELADLLDAENQLVEALPKMAEASYSPALKTVVERHIEVTKSHIRRLKDIFDNVGQVPQGVVCKVMRVLISEIEHVVHTSEKGIARDSAMITIAQRIEHYEITGYAIAHEHADDLRHTQIVDLVNETLNEERTMHLQLSELAQGLINTQAIDPQMAPEHSNKAQAPAKGAGQGFYVTEDRFGRKNKKKKSSDDSRYKE